METLMRNREWVRTLSEMFNDFSTGIETFSYGYPKVNTVEEADNFRVDVYYPGLKKENFKIKVEDKRLLISSNFSEKKEESGEKYHFREFAQKEFSKGFVLPDEVIKNKIKASYEDGVLKVTIPKDKVKEKQSKFEVTIE